MTMLDLTEYERHAARGWRWRQSLDAPLLEEVWRLRAERDAAHETIRKARQRLDAALGQDAAQVVRVMGLMLREPTP